MSFVPPVTLEPDTVAVVQSLLRSHPHFVLYFEAALSAPVNDKSNRKILVGIKRRGLALSIDFERVTIRTTVGDLSDAELLEAVTVPRRAELHLEAHHLDFTRARLSNRVVAIKQLKLYRLNSPTFLEADPRCRRLGSEDESIVAVFFARDYPSTIFSSWMLAQHFYGLFEQNELRSCGGVVVSNLKLGSANLGNFLTSPNHRGRGLAGAVASTLIHDLEAKGLHTFVLATTEENVPARRTYERLGFHVVETRPQVDLCAPGGFGLKV